jgi:hypothetical protein
MSGSLKQRQLLFDSEYQSLNTFEQIEFKRRVDLVIDSLTARNNLIIAFKKLKIDQLATNKRAEIVTPTIIVILALISGFNFYLTSSSISAWALTIILVMVCIYYKISNQIRSWSEINFDLLAETKIARYTDLIEQYAFLHPSDEGFLCDWEDGMEAEKYKDASRKNDVILDLNFEVLRRMNLGRLSKNGN